MKCTCFFMMTAGVSYRICIVGLPCSLSDRYKPLHCLRLLTMQKISCGFLILSKPPFYYKQSVARKLQPCWVHIEDEERELTLFFDDLYRRSGCKKLLVFANSRKKCEQLYDILNQKGVFSQKVFLHYSNLSTQERKIIEASFRDGKMGVCIATSTLELGIDIGDVDGVVLMGPPPSTMAFLQRIGRGNRRQQHINFWGVCYGQSAGMQLVRFLAFFELAKEHQVEKCLWFRELQRAISADFILSLRKKSIIKRFIKSTFQRKIRGFTLHFSSYACQQLAKTDKAARDI